MENAVFSVKTQIFWKTRKIVEFGMKISKWYIFGDFPTQWTYSVKKDAQSVKILANFLFKILYGYVNFC